MAAPVACTPRTAFAPGQIRLDSYLTDSGVCRSVAGKMRPLFRPHLSAQQSRSHRQFKLIGFGFWWSEALGDPDRSLQPTSARSLPATRSHLFCGVQFRNARPDLIDGQVIQHGNLVSDQAPRPAAVDSLLHLRSDAREMLANGPISNFRPERGEDDPAANEVYARLIELRADRVGIVRELTAMGVMVTEEPTKGILNASGRAFARSFIEGAPESPERANALSKFAKLEELDRQIDEADAEWVEHLQIYWEAEWKGRDIYRERLRDLARKAADEGRPYHSEHLFGHWK